MPEDQSVVGRRRIYYDPTGGEALICSDSEEEVIEEEEDTKIFARSEDYILWLHGCSQDLIFPTEKQNPWIAPEVSNKPCGPYCYRSAKKSEGIVVAKSLQCDDSRGGKPRTTSDDASPLVSPKRKSNGSGKRKGKYAQSESASSNAKNESDSCDSDFTPGEDDNNIDESSIQLKTKSNGKSEARKSKKKRAADRILVAMQKRQKNIMNQDSDSVTSGGNSSGEMILELTT